MVPPAATARIVSRSPVKMSRLVGRLLARLQQPAGALAFVSGRNAPDLEQLGASLAPHVRGVPVLVVHASGVLSERGELEHESALVAVAWSGGRTRVVTADGPEPKHAARLLGSELASPDEPGRPSSVIVFAGAEGFGAECVEPLASLAVAPRLFGATVAGERVLGLEPDGTLRTGRAGALRIKGIGSPVVRSASACRAICSPRRVTRARGALVFEIEGEPALDVLGEVGSGLGNQPLIVAAVHGDGPEPLGVPLIRGVNGIDPLRGGIQLSAAVPEGTWLSFAAREAAISRAGLEQMLREMAQSTCGGAPRFGLYLKGGGRGESLYGAPDVEIRLIRARFGELPVVGVNTVSEIVSVEGALSLQLLSGTLALYTLPS